MATNNFGEDDAGIEEIDADDLTGEPGDRTSDTAAHLLDDTRAEQFGTHDMQEAIERGVSYEPPDHAREQGETGSENQ